MIALQRLGYETATTATKKDKLPKAYDATWRGYYNNYWKARVPDFQDFETGNPTPDMMNHIINEYNSHRATDDDGFLRVKIPVPMLAANTLSVEIGFFNFPVVQEATLPKLTLPFRRSDDVNVETQFDIKWNGTQNITWNNDTHWGKGMGWEVWQSRTLRGELKVSETLDVGVFSALKVFNTISFSRFYIHDNNTTPHFVLLGMQWCQPVWDGVDDPDPGATISPTRSNDFSFVNMKHNGTWVRGLNMHIPSKHTTGSGPYYGVIALKSPFPRPKKHEGVDLYSGANGSNPTFAIHAGVLKKYHHYGYGYRAYLLLGGVGDPCFHYAHLQEEVVAKDWVMAGEIVGISGLTRYVVKNTNAPDTVTSFQDEPYHLHLEFIKSATSTTPAIGGAKSDFSEIVNINPAVGAGYKAPTGANAFLFQGNKLPLLLPCKSVYRGEDDQRYLNECKVGNETNTSYQTCYAIQKFPYTNNLLLSHMKDLKSDNLHPTTGLIRYICPHILGADASKSVQLQAKIKFIYVNQKRFNPTILPKANQVPKAIDPITFLTSDYSKIIINGNTTNLTTIIKELIKAHYCSINGTKLEDSSLIKGKPVTNKKIDNTRVNAFIKKYTSNTEIPNDDDHSVVRDFHTWFSNLNFSKMCLNVAE